MIKFAILARKSLRGGRADARIMGLMPRKRRQQTDRRKPKTCPVHESLGKTTDPAEWRCIRQQVTDFLVHRPHGDHLYASRKRSRHFAEKMITLGKKKGLATIARRSASSPARNVREEAVLTRPSEVRGGEGGYTSRDYPDRRPTPRRRRP
jgi:ribosomal protein L17